MAGGSLATARALALAVPAALLAGAWGFQLIGHLVPCEMCHWQRWPLYAALALALLALVVPLRSARAPVALAGLCILAAGLIGAFHAGVEYHWWEGLTRCTTALRTGGSSADMLRQIMAAPLIRCDQAQWTLFGISLAGFNALISIPMGLAILALCLRRR